MCRHKSLGGEGLCCHQRIRRSADFSRCYRRGRKRHGRLAALHYLPNASREARLGITASRRVGNSVVRHRLKRRVREIFRRSRIRRALGPLDVVVHLKPGSAQVSFVVLTTEINRLLESLVAQEVVAR